MSPGTGSRFGTVTTICALLLSLAVVAPVQAQAPATAGAGVVDFYLSKSTLTTDAPTATASEARSIMSMVTTPAVNLCTCGTDWAGYKIPHDLTFTNHAVVTFWITADTKALWINAQADIKRGTASVGAASRGTAIDSNTGAPLGWNQLDAGKYWKLEIAVPVRGVEWKAGDELRLTLSVWGVGHGGTPTEIRAVYGSVNHPSRISVPVDSLGGLAPSGGERSLYLGDKELTWQAPTGTASKKRASESAVNGVTVATMASSTEFSWGKIKTTEPLTLTGDSFLEVWVTVDGAAGVMRGIRALIYVDGALCCQMDRGLLTATFPAAGATAVQTNRYLFGLNTGGREIPAGSEIDIRFLTWSSTSEAGKITFLYGSETHPAGLHLRSSGGAADAGSLLSVLLSSDASELTGPAGASADGAFSVSNPNAEPVNVSLDVSGDLPVAFESVGPHALAPDESASFDFSVDLSSATADQIYGITVKAMVDGVEVANMTFPIIVTAAAPAATEAPPTSASETAAAKTEDAGESPGAGAVALLVGTLGLAVALRRRRN